MIGVIRSRERRRRKDFCAQTANQLRTTNALVVIEDLKTKQMTRSAKGTLKTPGINVKAKSGLNRAILQKGWHQFALALSSAAPLQRDAHCGRAGAAVATLLGLRAGGPEIP